MQGRDLQKFVNQYLLPALPGFAYARRVIYQVPVGDLLRGLLLDSSGFSKAVLHPDVFVQPLYVPSSHLVLSFGRRLTGSWRHEAGNAQALAKRLLRQMREAVLPFASSFSSPQSFAANAPAWPWFSRDNPHIQQAMGYSLVLAGDFASAQKWLRAVDETLRQCNNAETWEGRLRDDCRKFLDLLVRDPGGAQELLNGWTEDTRRNLRLPQPTVRGASLGAG